MTKPKGLLIEASLARVYGHWKERGFAVVSADRGDRTPAENKRWRGMLKGAIRASGHGFIPLVGYWYETTIDDTGAKVRKQVQEFPFLIPANDASEDLAPLAIELGRVDRRNAQETVLVVSPGGEAHFYNTRQDAVYNNGAIGKVAFKLPTFAPGKVSDIYSRLRNKARKGGEHTSGAFVFEGWTYTPTPATFMEATRRKHAGELEFISNG